MPGNSAENPLHVQVSETTPHVQVSTLFTTTKPASDAELTSFWNLLHQLSTENDILHLPLIRGLIKKANRTLYVRQAYKDLFTIICNYLNSGDIEDRTSRIAITGTPGIGKSMFLFYIMWRLTKMEVTKTVILRRHMDEKVIYVFQNEGCWATQDDSKILRFLNDETTWYLTDTLEPPPGQVEAITILVASPARRHYETFSRYLNTAPLHYFPVWSLEELKLVAPFYSRELKDVEERYYKIGGVPRYVLEKDHDLKKVILGAVGRLAIEKLPLIASGSVSKEDQVSHLIVQLIVDTSSYLDFTLQMASPYATQMAMELFILNQEEEVKRFILNTSPIPVLATLRGALFEAYAHQKMSRGGKFIGRSLENEEECEVNIPAMDIGRFFNVSECKDPKMYYVPWYSNHPCIDSAVLNMGYFQMTISWEHDIVWSKMKEMVDVLKMDKLYFVVPHTLFEKFQRQKLVRNMGNQGGANREETSMSKRSFNEEDELNAKRQRTRRGKDNGNSQNDIVHQYVIPISLEPSMEALLSKIIGKEQMAQHSGKN